MSQISEVREDNGSGVVDPRCLSVHALNVPGATLEPDWRAPAVAGCECVGEKRATLSM